MKVSFKKLNDGAVLPSYSKAGDCGMDLTATSEGEVTVSEDRTNLWYYIEYKTGLAVEIPKGYVGLIFPRSSISKSALTLANAVGVIDSGYRGEICLRFKLDYGVTEEGKTNGGEAHVYIRGDRIGQLVIMPYPTIEPEFVNELDQTERGAGGFGSSGS